MVCPAYAGSDAETAEDLVEKALVIFKTNSKDQAIKYCNATMGPLRKGSIYVFAVDFKGHMLSHPVQGDLRNRDTWELQDAKGTFIIQEFIKIAKGQGSGWIEYWWNRAGQAAATLKKTYIKRVPGEDILVGAGYYAM